MGFINYAAVASAIKPLKYRRVGAKGLARYDTPLGRYYLPKSPRNDAVATDIRSGRLFDAGVVAAVLRNWTTGTQVLDVGANFGQMSIVLARKMLATQTSSQGDVPLVTSFEAEPTVNRILRMNVEANGLGDRITVVDDPVWDESGVELRFPEPDFQRFGSWGSYGVSPLATAGRSLTSTTIDGRISEPTVSVIKVDVQGSDLRALQGACNLIARDRPVIIFEFEQQFVDEFALTFQDYVEFIASIDYRFDSVIDNNFVCRPITNLN